MLFDHKHTVSSRKYISYHYNKKNSDLFNIAEWLAEIWRILLGTKI